MSGKRSRREREAKRRTDQGTPSWISSNRRRLGALAIVGLAIAAAAVVAVVAFGGRGKVEKTAAPAANRQALAAGRFHTVLASGAALTSRELAGRPTVAAFVIEDCTSCVETLRTLTALSKDGVRTIAVNVNVPSGTNPVSAAQRLASFGRAVNAGNQIIYAADPAQRTATAYHVRQIESYLLFDKHGREVGHGIALSPKQIRRALKLA